MESRQKAEKVIKVKQRSKVKTICRKLKKQKIKPKKEKKNRKLLYRIIKKWYISDKRISYT